MLEKHLVLMQREGLISGWHDRKLVAGDVVDTEIDEHLRAADIVLLLVSSDFFASDYCYDREMEVALQRHADGLNVVVPVILRPCEWTESKLGKLLALPIDGKPVSTSPDVDAAFTEVAKGIRSLLLKMEKAAT